MSRVIVVESATDVPLQCSKVVGQISHIGQELMKTRSSKWVVTTCTQYFVQGSLICRRAVHTINASVRSTANNTISLKSVRIPVKFANHMRLFCTGDKTFTGTAFGLVLDNETPIPSNPFVYSFSPFMRKCQRLG